MTEVYVYDGESFYNQGEFIDAVSHGYKEGDHQGAIDALEEHGFSLADIGVRPGAA